MPLRSNPHILTTSPHLHLSNVEEVGGHEYEWMQRKSGALLPGAQRSRLQMKDKTQDDGNDDDVGGDVDGDVDHVDIDNVDKLFV